MRALRAMLVAAVALVGSFGTAITGAPAAGAWSDGPCPTADGVTVIIDFGDLGGGVYVRCAPGSPTSGFDALQRANIAYDTAIRQPGFLCRIAGEPASDPCIDTSPASAYWSYWLAPRGGNWCYSNLGAGARTPPMGTVEGWSFSMTRSASQSPAPRMTPPAAVSGSPTALPASHCDTGSTAPTAAPTTRPAATTAPTTVTPSSPSNSTPSAASPSGAGPVNAAPAAPSTTRSTSNSTSGGEASTAPADGQTALEAPTDSTPTGPSSDAAIDPGTDAVAEAPGESPTTMPGGEGNVASTTIQLDPDDDSGSPMGAIAAGGVLAAGAVVGLVMRKRAQHN